MENTECIITIACHGIRILESETILLGESGLHAFGIGNTAQELRRNPTKKNYWNPESKFRWQRLEPIIDMTSKEL